MGWRISWLAVRGIDKDEVYRRIGAMPTGEIGMMLDHPVTGKLFPGGWTIVVFDELAHRLVGDDEVERLSAGCSIVVGNLCETTMCSTASLWKNCDEVWGVWHFSNDTVDHLEMVGDLPAEFEATEKQYRELQAKENAGDARLHDRDPDGARQTDDAVSA